MIKRVVSGVRLAGFVLSLLPAVASAGYLGNTVSADYRYPTVTTNYAAAGGPLTSVVGPGVEFAFFGGTEPTVDVSDQNILIAYPQGFSLDPAANPFDGIVVTSVSPGTPDIVGVSLAGTNIAGTVGLSFDARHVYVNQDSLANTFASGAFISVNVQFAQAQAQAIPTLSPWALAVCTLVLAGIGIAYSRRRPVSS